jgi:hypothetical protein
MVRLAPLVNSILAANGLRHKRGYVSDGSEDQSRLARLNSRRTGMSWIARPKGRAHPRLTTRAVLRLLPPKDMDKACQP